MLSLLCGHHFTHRTLSLWLLLHTQSRLFISWPPYHRQSQLSLICSHRSTHSTGHPTSMSTVLATEPVILSSCVTISLTKPIIFFLHAIISLPKIGYSPSHDTISPTKTRYLRYPYLCIRSPRHPQDQLLFLCTLTASPQNNKTHQTLQDRIKPVRCSPRMARHRTFFDIEFPPPFLFFFSEASCRCGMSLEPAQKRGGRGMGNKLWREAQCGDAVAMTTRITSRVLVPLAIIYFKGNKDENRNT